eukprot:851381-Pyramimonas_sp.AAC.1
MMIRASQKVRSSYLALLLPRTEALPSGPAEATPGLAPKARTQIRPSAENPPPAPAEAGGKRHPS